MVVGRQLSVVGRKPNPLAPFSTSWKGEQEFLVFILTPVF